MLALVANYDDVIVMNKIKFENFAAHKHAIIFHNILCLTTKKMLPPPLLLQLSHTGALALSPGSPIISMHTRRSGNLGTRLLLLLLALHMATVVLFKSSYAFVTDHFEALARLIELNRRAGKLEDCNPFLDQVTY